MRQWKFWRRGSIVLLIALACAAVAAAPAGANTTSITISCSGVTFFYSNFPTTGANTSQETVYVDNVPVANTTFDFSGQSTATDTLPLSLSPGTHTIIANAATSSDEGTDGAYLAQTVTCGGGPPCPTGTKVNFRWHYSANGTSGSWSGTKSVFCPGSLTTSQQAMEGDLRVAPGTTLKVGYDFTIPGNSSSLFVTVTNPQVVFVVHCVSGAPPSSNTLTVGMPNQTYNVTNSAWYPSGDQHSPLVYQGSVSVPDLCAGGQVRLNSGGTFSATVS